MIQKINVLVTRTDEYEISIDTATWTPEGIEAWSGVFTDAETPEDIARIIAERISRDGLEVSNHEGFGDIPRYIISKGKLQQIVDKEPVDYSKSLSVTVLDAEDFVTEAEIVTSCRVCGCTDKNCTGCIERTGDSCYWVENDLCSACVNFEDNHA
ncbi:hypothetical protein [Flavobacterium beibuense]|uniref:hypothetical protein n=1 Tax=Flavobacterium beibuense TaxID=657326 RepID=UPI003A8EB00A